MWPRPGRCRNDRPTPAAWKRPFSAPVGPQIKLNHVPTFVIAAHGTFAASFMFSAVLGFAPHSFRAKPDPKPAEKPGGRPRACQGGQKVDEFAEAQREITGPAGNPECVWLGRRVVGLLWRDDLDTAFRHLDLYDRFGCPGAHIQASFRCLILHGGQHRSEGGRQPQRAASKPAGSIRPAPPPAPAAAPAAAAPAAKNDPRPTAG